MDREMGPPPLIIIQGIHLENRQEIRTWKSIRSSDVYLERAFKLLLRRIMGNSRKGTCDELCDTQFQALGASF